MTRRVAVLALALTLSVCASASAATSITDRLTTDHTAIEVTSKPEGTAYVHVAAMKTLAGEAVVYYDVPGSQTVIKPPSRERPVLDVQAFSSSHTPIGGWAGRLQTSEAPVEEPPKEEPPREEPPPSGFRVGVDTGGWYLTNDSAVMGGKKLLLRSQNLAGPEISAYASHGFPVIDLFGHGGPTSQNAETYATEAIGRAKAHPNIVATELLNEPGNPYLSGCWSRGCAEAYARFVNVVADRFVAAYTANLAAMPRLLWSGDGGYGGAEWARWTWPLLHTNARTFGRPTDHPYGGTGERAKSALGGRKRVEETVAATGEKVWVTEVGFPTCVGCANTGDSLQWTWAEQAQNIESFIRWAPAFAEATIVFQYRDYGSNDFYGVETSGGTHKPSFDVLQHLAP